MTDSTKSKSSCRVNQTWLPEQVKQVKSCTLWVNGDE